MPNERDDVEPKLALRQRPGAGFFGHIRAMILRAGSVHTVPDPDGQAPEPIEAHDRAMVMIGHPQPLSTRATLLTQGTERLLMRTGRPAPATPHSSPHPPPAPPAGLRRT